MKYLIIIFILFAIQSSSRAQIFISNQKDEIKTTKIDIPKNNIESTVKELTITKSIQEDKPSYKVISNSIQKATVTTDQNIININLPADNMVYTKKATPKIIKIQLNEVEEENIEDYITLKEVPYASEQGSNTQESNTNSPAINNVQGTYSELSAIYFEENSSNISPKNYKAIYQVIDYLNENPNNKVYLTSFSDSLATEIGNEQIRAARINEVQKTLCNTLNISKESLLIKSDNSEELSTKYFPGHSQFGKVSFLIKEYKHL